ncbi:MAG: UvrD-helicase domain-containing protein [Lachnospiraceae bacterium]|nr:UvrD-helicase domain-containing protein [Lachnospiraceae bacterium]
MKFTDDQQKVIDLRNENILVSAAAGSGKTAVLVERILRRIAGPADRKPEELTEKEDDRIDVDRLLVVTFTKAAAAEMRERIGKAIADELAKFPDDLHLQRQSALIHNAQISTIHSFCTFLLRNHFREAGIDPGFRVGDEGELAMIRRDVLGELLEAEYAAKSPDFLRAMEALSTGKTDDDVEEIIFKLYDYAMSYPWPHDWLKSHEEDLCLKKGEKWEDNIFVSYAMDQVRNALLDARERLLACREMAETAGGPWMYGENLDASLDSLEGIEEAETWEELRAIAEGVPFGILSSKKDPSVDKEMRDRCKKLRNGAKERIEKLCGSYFLYSDDAISRYGELAAKNAAELIRLVLAFEQAFSEAKRKKNLGDFSDLEHIALKILCRHEEGEAGWTPTDTALFYRDYYQEVMCDEYQDSNFVQETILQAVSGSNDRFMVGDVKQSIYRFRLARPELFLKKEAEYSKEPGGGGRRIDLHQNFRSREGVIDSVNFLFEALMDHSFGKIDYDEDAALKLGATYPPYEITDPVTGENFGKTELLIRYLKPAPVPDEEDAEEGAEEEKSEEKTKEKEKDKKKDKDAEPKISKDDKLTLEAEMIAKRILELTAEGVKCVTEREKDPVTGKETMSLRNATFGDIVILIRSDSGKADAFKKVLEENNIPCYINSQEGYYDVPEVAVLLQLLQALNNPLDDIPLFGALKSVFGGFTDAEIAELRIGRKPHETLFGSVKRCAATNGSSKAARFLEWYEDLRAKAVYLSISELLEEIIERNGYLEYVSALPSGEQRRANVLMLMQKAIAFEQTSFRGLYHFVRYIEQIRKFEVKEGEASILDEHADVVRIMTIHKSKGLEFPICFVSGLGGNFNRKDSRASVITDMEYGIALDYVDPEQRTKARTLQRQVLSVKTNLDTQAEELRVLYVALTRAREKLIMTGVAKEEADLALEFAPAAGSSYVLPYSVRSRADSFLEWIVKANSWIAAQMGPDEKTPIAIRNFYLESKEEAAKRKQKATMKTVQDFLQHMKDQKPDPNIVRELEEKFSYRYPHEALQNLHEKTTVSELKMAAMQGLDDEGEGDDVYVLDGVNVVEADERHIFGSVARPGAAYGSAMHRFMELYEYGAAEPSEAEVKRQLDLFAERGRISEEYRNLVRIPKILGFLQSDLGKRVAACAASPGRVKREQPFVFGISASRLGEEYPESETVLVQGIIDLYLLEEDGDLVLVDYKTDHVKTPEELVLRYRTQMDYYREALEKLTGKRVKERILYSFCLDKEVRVEEI